MHNHLAPNNKQNCVLNCWIGGVCLPCVVVLCLRYVLSHVQMLEPIVQHHALCRCRWHQQLQSVQSATKGEQDKATEKHVQEVQQMQSQLAGARAESAQLGEQLNQTQTMIQVSTVLTQPRRLLLRHWFIHMQKPGAAVINSSHTAHLVACKWCCFA